MAYASGQLIQAVEEGKSLDEVMTLASDLTLNKVLLNLNKTVPQDLK